MTLAALKICSPVCLPSPPYIDLFDVKVSPHDSIVIVICFALSLTYCTNRAHSQFISSLTSSVSDSFTLRTCSKCEIMHDYLIWSLTDCTLFTHLFLLRLLAPFHSNIYIYIFFFQLSPLLIYQLNSQRQLPLWFHLMEEAYSYNSSHLPTQQLVTVNHPLHQSN